ncbi:MAG: hypothetical protein ABII09_05580 [Planctomycetota bacterium]
MKKNALVVASLFVLAMTGSTLAWAPMGSPTTDLKQGQFRAGFEYAHSSTDFDVDFGGLTLSADNVKSDFFVANIGYGLLDDWEMFVRLGAANAEADYGFDLGFGTKVTVLRKEKFSLGVLFQANWFRSDDSVDGIDATLKVYEIQFAAGPSYKLSDNISVFGGPFLHFIGGKLDIEGYDTYDVKEDAEIGDFVGLEAEVCRNTSLYGEFQLASGQWAVGSGINFKF